MDTLTPGTVSIISNKKYGSVRLEYTYEYGRKRCLFSDGTVSTSSSFPFEIPAKMDATKATLKIQFADKTS
ncbi:hypothetical protein [Bacillus cereus]|uniref:hypothetical protein n=1 Tax=Bacillus cereus TaxID=1396 RepID=UPI002115EE59|nr:hypothetical protein [Bacillus cereus]